MNEDTSIKFSNYDLQKNIVVKCKLSDLVFTTMNGEVISVENNNLWLLHELHPDDQDITIEVKEQTK